jgi:hypothetical protein
MKSTSPTSTSLSNNSQTTQVRLSLLQNGVFGNNSLNLSKSRLSGLGSYWGIPFGLAGMISTKPASSNTFGSRKTTARGEAANVVRRLRYV